jgi:hypothetical protein
MSRVIKGKQSATEEGAGAEKINVSILEYILVAAVGLMDTWIYYNIHQ